MFLISKKAGIIQYALRIHTSSNHVVLWTLAMQSANKHLCIVSKRMSCPRVVNVQWSGIQTCKVQRNSATFATIMAVWWVIYVASNKI